MIGQKTQIEDLEKKIKESQEAFMQVSHDSKKTIAMRDQKIEFLTLQLKEVKDQLEESQRQHESMVQALNKQHEVSSDDGQSAARLEMLQKELDSVNENHLAQIKELKAENDDLVQKLSDIEHSNKLNANDLSLKLAEANQASEEVALARDTLLERVKVLEADKKRITEESDEKIAKIKSDYDNELQEKETEKQAELVELSQRHEE